MSQERSTVEVLKAARERISDPRHWAQGEFAYTADGEYCPPNEPQACSWCLAGAVFAELDLRGTESTLTLEDVPAIRLLAKAASPNGQIERVTTAVEAIGSVNDAHPHAWALDVLDRAIELAEVK